MHCCVGGAQLEAVLEEMPKWGLVQEVLQVFCLLNTAVAHRFDSPYQGVMLELHPF